MGMNNDVQVNNGINKLRPTGKEQMPGGSKKLSEKHLEKGAFQHLAHV